MKFFASAAAVLVFASTSFATIQDEFERLKDSGENFTVLGQICETVAQHEYEALYPAAKYEVLNGIAYSDSRRTIGELDVVVIENATKNVVSIGEVKCWNDNHKALTKARDQRARFLSAVKSMSGLHFSGTHDKRAYSQSQFKGVTEFKSVGPLGSKADGFDIEIEYSLKDLMDLRTKLMTCQQAGECKQP